MVVPGEAVAELAGGPGMGEGGPLPQGRALVRLLAPVPLFWGRARS